MRYSELRQSIAGIIRRQRTAHGCAGFIPFYGALASVYSFTANNAPEFLLAISRGAKVASFGPELRRQRDALEGAGGFCPRCNGMHRPIPCSYCRHGEDRTECGECP